MGSPQIIELNGRHYDARSGKEVANHTKPANYKPTAIVSSVDGIAKRHHPPRKTSSTSQQRTQRSHTLKRSAVNKPQNVKNVISHKPKSHQVAVPIQTKTTPQPKHSVPAARLQRLKSVEQNKLVRRFNSELAPTNHQQVSKVKQRADNVVQAVSSVVEQPINAFGQAVENATSHTAKKSRKAPIRHRVASKLRVSTRVLNAGAMTVAIFLFVGFFGYHNGPNLSMRVASMRSQVSGSLPGYLPNGFSLERGISYKPGEIVVGYQSNSDERYFEIKQTASQWDSEALQQNFVAEQEQVRTIQDKGKTVYLYEDSNATWVDGGIWYRIEGESLLNSDQLGRLANSL